MTTPLSSGDARDLDELIDEIVSNSKDVEMYSTVEYDLSMRQRAIEEVQRLRGEIHGKFSTLRAERSEQGKDREDAADLDWLETKVVNVRNPTPYGSLDLFWSSPGDEGDEPSDLRAQIRAARITLPDGAAPNEDCSEKCEVSESGYCRHADPALHIMTPSSGDEREAVDLVGHPRFGNNGGRDEIELFLRDAYAAGANAAHRRSLVTAMEYAEREAPKLRTTLRAEQAKDREDAEEALRCAICGGLVRYDGTPPSIDFSTAGRARKTPRQGDASLLASRTDLPEQHWGIEAVGLDAAVQELVDAGLAETTTGDNEGGCWIHDKFTPKCWMCCPTCERGTPCGVCRSDATVEETIDAARATLPEPIATHPTQETADG